MDSDTPQWVQRMFPDGLPASDPLLFETPMSDAQQRFLASLGVRNRWCSREEASQLINQIKRGQRAAARMFTQDVEHAIEESTAPVAAESDDEKPGQIYSRKATVADVVAILTSHGWKVAHVDKRGVPHLTRPNTRKCTMTRWPGGYPSQLASGQRMTGYKLMGAVPPHANFEVIP